MTKEYRKHPRQTISLDVELSLPSGEVQVVKTQDVSVGGAFLVLGGENVPRIGEVVSVKLVDNQQSDIKFPSSDAVVVRQELKGIGLAFIEMELSD